MMNHHRHMGYLSHNGELVSKPKRRIFSIFLCFFLAFGFVASTVGDALLAPASSSVVHAGDDEDTMNESATDVQKDQDGFAKALTEATSGGVPPRNSFGYVLHRLFSMSYLNNTQDGVAASGYDDKDWQCNQNDPHAGTAVYHNCDVPNIMTEFMQTVTALLIPVGPQNAETGQAKVPFGLGLPSTIPGNGTVPVNPANRSVKYTGLELFGYNLKYTNYRGEWDDIKVMTEARTLSNFGVMDSLRLGIATVVNGIVGGVTEGVASFLDGLSRGDLLGAIGGFFSGLFGGGASAAVNTVLDTSDMNVFNMYAWYRVDYGATLYRARELNQTEIAANIQAKFVAYITNSPLSKVDLPAEFVNIKPGPPRPLEAISKCTATKSDGTKVEIKDTSNPPGGISEADCKAEALSTYNDSAPVWTIDGTQKLELIKDWKVHYSSIFAAATKYGMSCTISDDEANRQTNLDTFYACWATSWDSRKAEVKLANQNATNQSWFQNLLLQKAMVDFFSKPENNFNAPWNRFVCTDANGKDLEDGITPRMLFQTNGNYNPNCQKVRPPIQNGYYGNGYTADTPGGVPTLDTRWKTLERYSIFDVLVQPFSVFGDSSMVGNVGLNIATFFTQASNAVIDLAFAPILQKLGLDTKIVSIIEAFRDSVYFPFISFLMALAGFTILFQAGKRRAYAAAFKDLAIVIGTFMLGVIILFNPKGLLKVVDEFPAQIEAGILGTIFNVGLEQDDGVCTAQQAVGAGGETDLSGQALTFSPRASIRTMECEIWRTFAFNPWVMGQWGTTYDQLYSNGNAAPGGKALTNSNGGLVGNAAVTMGGGKTIYNWALYQLDVTSAGTATTEDLTKATGQTPRDFYRIVDAQAGPNNGVGTDGRFFDSWSGNQPGARNAIGALSGFVAVVGFITIAAYSIVKIEITLLTAVMLLFLPLFLLLGVHPTFGRIKLKQYVNTIIALMIQRIVLITLLAVMLKMVTAISLSTQNYLLGGLLAAGTCAAFLAYRKEIFGLITNSVAAKGGLFAQDYVNNTHGKFQEMMPLSVRNKVGMTKVAMVNGAGGFVGGYVSGGMKGGLSSAKQASMLGQHRLRNQQRRTGVGLFTKFNEAQDAGERVGKAATAKRNEETGVLTEEQVAKNLNKEFTDKRLKDYKAGGKEAPLTETGKTEWMNVDPKAAMNKKDLTELTALESRISQLEKQNADGYIPKGVLPKDASDMDKLRARKHFRDQRNNEIGKLKVQRDEVKDRLYKKNAHHMDFDWYADAEEVQRVEAAKEAEAARKRAEKDPDAAKTDEPQPPRQYADRETVKSTLSTVERLSFETARLREKLAETAEHMENFTEERREAHYNKGVVGSAEVIGNKIEEKLNKASETIDKKYRTVKRGDGDK